MEPKNSNLTELDFEMEKEVWNKYELENNAQLRTRVVMVKFFYKHSQGVPKEYSGQFTPISNVMPYDNYKLFGKAPHAAYTPEEMQVAKSTEVSYRTIAEDWNIYRLSDGTRIKTKLVVASINRLLDRYDQYGVPIYTVNSTTVINIDAKKS
jgi:hypothetical protein